MNKFLETFKDRFDYLIKGFYQGKRFFQIIDRQKRWRVNCRDVARILKYIDKGQAIRKNIPLRFKIRYEDLDIDPSLKIYDKHYKRYSWFTNEAGLFRLIIKCQKEQSKLADEFSDYVTDKLLPSMVDLTTYHIKYNRELLQSTITHVEQRFEILTKELETTKSIFNKTSEAIANAQAEAKDDDSYAAILNLFKNFQKQSKLLLNAVEQKNELEKENFGLRIRVNNMVVEISYWKKGITTYLPAKDGYLYVMKLIVFENGFTKEAFGIGVTKNMNKRMPNYKNKNMMTYLVAYIPINNGMELDVMDKTMKAIYTHNIFRFQHEIYYDDITLENILDSAKNILSIMSTARGQTDVPIQIVKLDETVDLEKQTLIDPITDISVTKIAPRRESSELDLSEDSVVEDRSADDDETKDEDSEEDDPTKY